MPGMVSMGRCGSERVDQSSMGRLPRNVVEAVGDARLLARVSAATVRWWQCVFVEWSRSVLQCQVMLLLLYLGKVGNVFVFLFVKLPWDPNFKARPSLLS